MLTGVLLMMALLAAAPVPAEQIEAPAVALIHEQNQEYDQAIERYTDDLEATELELGPYAEQLIKPLMGLARSYTALGKYSPAIAAIERAQHLSHRYDGVYTPRQLEGTDLLIEILLQQNEVTLADRQEKFALFIAEHNTNDQPLNLVPALSRISQWYIDTNQFNRAKQTLNRSQEIVRAEAKISDPRLLPSIIQLAKIKRLQRYCCSYKVLLEAVEILAVADTPSELKTEVYLELADSYTLVDKGIEAAKYYRLAWQEIRAENRSRRFDKPREITVSHTLVDNRLAQVRTFRPEKDKFGRKQFEPLSTREQLDLESMPPQEFFLSHNQNDYKVRIRDRNSTSSYDEDKITRVIGHPFQFIHKQLLNILPLNLRSDERLAQLQLELDFTVAKSGKISDVIVRSPLVPYKLSRLMRQVLKKSRFRPRLVDGVPVRTTHVKLYQDFDV